MTRKRLRYDHRIRCKVLPGGVVSGVDHRSTRVRGLSILRRCIQVHFIPREESWKLWPDEKAELLRQFWTGTECKCPEDGAEVRTTYRLLPGPRYRIRFACVTYEWDHKTDICRTCIDDAATSKDDPLWSRFRPWTSAEVDVLCRAYFESGELQPCPVCGQKVPVHVPRRGDFVSLLCRRCLAFAMRHVRGVPRTGRT